MDVVGYLHHADLLLEDEQGVAIISGNHYVLSLGDKVYIQHIIDQEAKLYQVHISFASAEHAMLHEDKIQIKFEGCRESLREYIHATTVH
ncbi:hypothetical protein B9T25_07635 [Acinetobacter sp. ANC 4470]|uniref:hypothetical protein n=1 Tax=Acinetobacter sp. ANC 4470 TaxID=1977881 RepID=UPI000A338834|nr:hypothetical protein [Acinetobacter sp. ANC 4470]OTG67844.1 hypothetical protein B9T25_07635 [Acinetobacter sp. ANC 4470]